MELSKIMIYRMTHIKNIPHILQYGITHKNSSNVDPDYITIGDKSLIDTRSTKHVIIDNGDFLNFDGQTIILGEYIPFYFGQNANALCCSTWRKFCRNGNPTGKYRVSCLSGN